MTLTETAVWHLDWKLDFHQVTARARQITMVLTDCDGVLTDNSVYYSANGEELKRFSLRDGMGVERLRVNGIQSAIITRESSLSVTRRAEKLNLKHFYLGIKDKRAHLEGILGQTGTSLNQLAYIGDDVNDLGIIEVINEAGLTAAPSDAMPEVSRAVHYLCDEAGGHGAFRDFAEWLLRMRNDT